MGERRPIRLPPKEQRPDKLSGTMNRVSRARILGISTIWRAAGTNAPGPPKEKAP